MKEKNSNTLHPLKIWMNAHGISSCEMSPMVGMAASTIRAIASGKLNPSKRTANIVSSLTGIPPGALRKMKERNSNGLHPLRIWMHAHDTSSYEMAPLVGLAAITIRSIASGKLNPSKRTANILSSFTGIPPGELRKMKEKKSNGLHPLRTWMDAHDTSSYEMAPLIGMSASTIRAIASGKLNPSKRTAEILSSFTGIPPGELMFPEYYNKERR